MGNNPQFKRKMPPTHGKKFHIRNLVIASFQNEIAIFRCCTDHDMPQNAYKTTWDKPHTQQCLRSNACTATPAQALMCAVQAFSLGPSYSRGTDCTKVTCYLARWLNNAMVIFQEIFLEKKLSKDFNSNLSSQKNDHQYIF